MRFIKSFLIILVLLNVGFSMGNHEKVTTAIRTIKSPRIDGKLDDEIWQSLPLLSDFVQVTPYNGSLPTQKTVVRTTYDDNAFYVSAMMYDEPDSIFCELGNRDSYNRISSDLFEVQIAPFEDGNLSYFFSVSASGVQSDLIYSSEGRDMNADAVWESAAKVTNFGWVAEVKIPYSALRFPKKDVQEWGLNFYRTVKRKEEKSSWNYVNNEIDQWWTQTGRVKNLEKINPPLRLSFMPYISGYLQNSEGNTSSSYNGGMDMKLGVSESFTLDMTLIPDFGQVQSDDQVLNLSPFEIHYSEKRQFFTEASELFNKGNLFYSRRIGSTPRKYWNAWDDLAGNEDVIAGDDKTQLINATKLSGRTEGGLGIGVFNAMTDETWSTIADTLSGDSRKYKTQEFTNYNLVVLDQSLKNNSYFSVANSNMYSNDYIADVYATEFRFFDPSMLYSFRGRGAVSNQFEKNDVDRGFNYDISAGKTNGKLQYEYDYSVISDTYDPNDMGFLRENNRIRHDMDIQYGIYKPFSIFRNMFNSFSVEYFEQYQPRKFRSMQLSYNIHATFKNFTSTWLYLELTPMKRNNFAEPRVDGRFFKKPKGCGVFSGLNTNSNKFYSISLRTGLFTSVDSDRDQLWYQVNLWQKFKFSNRFRLNYQIRVQNDINDHGYVEYMEDEDIIYFGRRNVQSMTNTMESNYMFSDKSSLNFRLRHYWSSADYDKFFTLNDRGYLDNTNEYNENVDINFNAFNIDMVYNWHFAPGSELSLVWKNAISIYGEEVIYNPMQNFQNTFDSPQTNSISLKILYYLDYLNFKKYNNV